MFIKGDHPVRLCKTLFYVNLLSLVYCFFFVVFFQLSFTGRNNRNYGKLYLYDFSQVGLMQAWIKWNPNKCVVFYHLHAIVIIIVMMKTETPF